MSHFQINGRSTAVRKGAVPAGSPLRTAAARQEPRNRTAISLLEVILALAILAGAVATLGHVMRIGTRSAADSRDLTAAQLLCESKMSELTARVVPLESVQRVPFETNQDWLYSIVVRSTEEENLFFVRVIVEEDVDPRLRPLSFMLDRWVLDPDLELLEEDEPESQAEEAGDVGDLTGAENAP